MDPEATTDEQAGTEAENFTVIKEKDKSIFETSSVYSEPCYEVDYKVSGSIRLGVWYRDDDGLLYVKVSKAEGLATTSGKMPNPYVKIYLLPDASKHSKRKTGIISKTNKPIFNELLKYKVNREELDARTLWVSIWDWGSLGRNMFLGELKIPLSSVDLSKSKAIKYQLEEHSVSKGTKTAVSSGKICVALKFDEYCSRRPSIEPAADPVAPVPKGSGTPSRLGVALPGLVKTTRSPSIQSTGSLMEGMGTLYIQIKGAEGLATMDSTGDINPFVRCYLLPFVSDSAKRKTAVVEKSLNPVWNEQFVYKRQQLDDLKTERALELTVWDMDRRGTNSFIGCVRLGPNPLNAGYNKDEDWMDSFGEEVTHWEDTMANPEEWVERWHVLRPSSKPLPKSGKGRKVCSEAAGEVAEGDSDGGSDSSSDEEEDFVEREQHFLSKAMAYSVSRRPKPVYYEISGEVELTFQYKDETLTLHIVKAVGLAAVDKSTQSSDPYVKMYLLPDTRTKRKTKVKKKTLDPSFDQTLAFKVTKEKLKNSYLWITVWSNELLQHNQFLGETGICFDLYDLEKPIEKELYRLKLYDFSNIALPDDPTTKIVEYRVTPKKPIPVTVKDEKNELPSESQPEKEQTLSGAEDAVGEATADDQDIDEPPTFTDESSTSAAEVPALQTTTAEVHTTEIQDEEISPAPTSTPSIPKIEIAPAVVSITETLNEEISFVQDVSTPSAPVIEQPTNFPETLAPEEPSAQAEKELEPAKDLPLDKPVLVEKASSSPPPVSKAAKEMTPPSVSNDVLKTTPPKKPPRAKKAKVAAKKKPPKPVHAPSTSNRIVVVSASTRPSRQPKITA